MPTPDKPPPPPKKQDIQVDALRNADARRAGGLTRQSAIGVGNLGAPPSYGSTPGGLKSLMGQ